MYTAREGLYRTLYYELYGQAPARMPEDVEVGISDVTSRIEAVTAKGGTHSWPLVQPEAIVVRRK